MCSTAVPSNAQSPILCIPSCIITDLRFLQFAKAKWPTNWMLSGISICSRLSQSPNVLFPIHSGPLGINTSLRFLQPEKTNERRTLMLSGSSICLRCLQLLKHPSPMLSMPLGRNTSLIPVPQNAPAPMFLVRFGICTVANKGQFINAASPMLWMVSGSVTETNL